MAVAKKTCGQCEHFAHRPPSETNGECLYYLPRWVMDNFDHLFERKTYSGSIQAQDCFAFEPKDQQPNEVKK